jgi:hypothetical protein
MEMFFVFQAVCRSHSFWRNPSHKNGMNAFQFHSLTFCFLLFAFSTFHLNICILYLDQNYIIITADGEKSFVIKSFMVIWKSLFRSLVCSIYFLNVLLLKKTKRKRKRLTTSSKKSIRLLTWKSELRLSFCHFILCCFKSKSFKFQILQNMLMLKSKVSFLEIKIIICSNKKSRH